jgi:hypothetical protein
MVICEICKKNINTIFSICKCNLFNICENCYKNIIYNLNTYINSPECKICKNPIEIKFNLNRFKYYSSIVFTFLKHIILYSIPIIYPIYNLLNDIDFYNLGIIIYTIIILDTFNLHIFIKKNIIDYDSFILIRVVISTIFLFFHLFLDSNFYVYIYSYIFPFYLLPFFIISSLYSFSILKEQYKIIKNQYTNIVIKLNN